MLGSSAGERQKANQLQPWERLAVSMALAMTVFCIVFWVYILVLSDEWIQKRNPYYSLDAGLLSVKVGNGIYSKIIGKMVEHVKGRELEILKRFPRKSMSLEMFSEYVCTLPKIPGYTVDLCPTWIGVKYASWMMIFGALLGCILLAVAGLLLYWYAFVKARSLTRKFFKVLYGLAPGVFLIATAGYVAGTFRVQEMIPRTGGAFVGSSVLFSGVAIVFSHVPFFIVSILLRPLVEEQRNEMRSEHKKLLRDLRGQDPYGSTGAGVPAAQGTLPQWQPGQLPQPPQWQPGQLPQPPAQA